MTQPWSYRSQFCGFSSSEDCLPIPGCGNPAAATVFYHSFTMLISYVFMNLFVAVILEGFSIAEYVLWFLCRVRHSVAIYGQLLLFCDQSMREKAWRSRKRGAQAT